MRAWLLLGLAVPCLAFADFTGQVVKVQDGDTLTVLFHQKQVKIRLESIDAPESKQAFGKRSQQSLAQLCAGKEATVHDTGKDRYGRTLGWVTCDGLDASSEQVRRGMAWVFVKYAAPNSPLFVFEATAKSKHLGLWVDPYAVPPWDWRAKQRMTRTRVRY